MIPVNFALLFDKRVPHIHQVCCGLAFAFSAKFHRSVTILANKKTDATFERVLRLLS